MDASLLVLVGLFVVFWLLLIRPQRRRQREQQSMIAAIEVGDEIVTAGGLYGDVTAVHDDELEVEIADGVQVRIARRAVAGVMPDDEEDDEIEEEPGEEAAEEAQPASDSADRS